LQRAFTEGNSERLREQAKETKAVVDLKKPSLPSFSSVEFLVRLRLIFSRRFVPARRSMRRLGVSWAASLRSAVTLARSLQRGEAPASTEDIDVEKKGRLSPALVDSSER